MTTTRGQYVSTNGVGFTRIDTANLRRYEAGLSALHLATQGERVDDRHWRWRYLDAPAGPACVVAALRDGCVVGRYASFRLDFVAGGRRVRAGLLGDLAVLPEARSWNCYRGLVSRCRDQSAADELAFSYAFVNRETADLSCRAGMIAIGAQPVFAGALDLRSALVDRGLPRSLAVAGAIAQPLVGVRRVRRAEDRFEIRALDRFDDGYDALWRSLEPLRRVSAVRDAAYMNWRYVDCPDREYRRLGAYRDGSLDGVTVWRRPARRSVAILEAVARADDERVLAALLDAAVECARQDGMTHVAASFPRRSTEARALRALGFRRLPHWLSGGQVAVAAGATGRAAPEADIANWHFSHGDCFV